MKHHQIAVSPGDSPVVQWLWSGPGLVEPDSAVEALRATLEERWPGVSVTVETPDVFLARALAVRALTTGPLRTNLRRGVLAHAGARARMHGARMRSAAVLMAVGAVLGGASLVWEASVRAKREALKTQFSARVNAWLGYTEKAKGQNALLIVERDLAARKARRQPLLNVFTPSLLGDLQHAVAELGAGPLTIGHFVLNANQLEIKGTAPSRTHGEALRSMLAAQGYQVDVAWDEGGANDVFSFAVTAEKGVGHE